MPSLVIHDVDFDLLEEQRKLLTSIEMNDSILSTMTADQQDALRGVVALLDIWSDDLYFSGVYPAARPSQATIAKFKRVSN